VKLFEIISTNRLPNRQFYDEEQPLTILRNYYLIAGSGRITDLLRTTGTAHGELLLMPRLAFGITHDNASASDKVSTEPSSDKMLSDQSNVILCLARF
jgi:hypothetical protein